MAKLNVPVYTLTGEELSEVEIKALIHATHPVDFFYANKKFRMIVNPHAITGEHNAKLDAVRTKLALVAGMRAEEANDKTLEEKVKDRLAAGKVMDVQAVAAVYMELNRASCERVVDAVITDKDADKQWNYDLPLTAELLLTDAPLGESVVRAFDKWYDLFTGGSQDGGVTKQETGATLTMNTPAQTEAEATPA